jgi:hypothetical protein
MNRRKKIKLAVLKESARLATRAALSAYPPLPVGWDKDLTLGTFWKDDLVVFELYLARDKPEDAIVLTTAEVDLYSGEVISVQVHEAALRQAAQQVSQSEIGSTE